MGKILLNVMYAGDYLKEENNVGHEVINMFRTDDGANYIYVNPYGLLADKHYKDIETVLLTRRINANKWEILAKATDLEDVLIPNDIINSVENKAKLDTLSKDTKKVYNFTFCSDIFERTGKDAVEETDDLRLKKEMQKLVHENQVEYIKENNVKYGGKYINDILNKNQNNDYATYVTFRADAFHLPNKPIYITADDTYGKEREKVTEADIVFHLPGVFFAKQSFKMYFPMEKPTGKKAWEQYEKKYEAYKNAYEILKGIIDNDELWQKENKSVQVNEDVIKQNQQNSNFLQIIKKEDDELVFSNLVSYFFANDNNLFKLFASKVLSQKIEKQIELSGKLKIFREKQNIDLWFEDDKNIIIIENKIKSKINGRVDKQIIAEHASVNFNEAAVVNKLINSQLKKYFYIVEKEKKENKYYFLLTPNYNDISLDEFNNGKNYRKIYYSDLYHFFKEVSLCDKYRDDRYLADFVNAMKKHTSPYNNDMYEEMKRRFVKCIEQV